MQTNAMGELRLSHYLTDIIGQKNVASSNVAYAYFNSRNSQVNFNANDPDNTNANLRGRPSVKVIYLCDYFPCVCAALNQPPSILPISASFAWSWNIFVSLARASSRMSRSLSVVTSS